MAAGRRHHHADYVRRFLMSLWERKAHRQTWQDDADVYARSKCC